MRLCNIIIYIMLFNLLLITCKEKLPQEKESNNSFSTANEIYLQKPIQGFINSRDDRDFYLIVLEETRVLDIHITGIKGVNHSINIWEGDNNPILIKQIDDTRKSSGERFSNFYAEPGAYYISIQHGDKDRKKSNMETPYKLTITDRDAINEEIESNDTSENANELKPNEEIFGYFSPAYNRMNSNKKNPFREEDWYVLDIDADFTKTKVINVYLNGVNGVNSVLYFFDSQKNELASSDNGGTGEDEVISGIGITEKGRFYIMATTKSYNVNHDEPYFIRAELIDHNSSMEMENNNSFDQANLIVNNNISGKINEKGDYDIYKFTPTSESTAFYKIALQPKSEIDLLLVVFNKNKKKLIEINNGGIEVDEVYPNLFIKDEFFISVSPKNNLQSNGGDYLLSVESIPHEKGDELEPNDRKADATTVSDTTIRGYISQKGDIDYYLLESSGRAKIKFEITGVKEGKINFSITDPLGFVIKSKDISGNDNVEITEMIDKKGYIIIKSITENYDNPYKIIMRSTK